MALITTDSVPPGERAAFISSVVSEQLMDLHLRQVGEAPVHCVLRGEAVGELRIADISGANVRGQRTRALIGKSPEPYYCISIQLAGSNTFRWSEEDLATSRGDIFVFDTLHNFELDGERPSRDLVLRLPKAWLDARVARPDLVAGTRLPRDLPLSRLLTSYLLHGLDVATELSPDAAALFATHAVELLAQALGERPSEEGLPRDALRAAVYVRACRLIALRHAEPALTPDFIARMIGVSLRLLQRIFAERGETIMGRVWDERVRRAAKLLAMPETSHRSVTEIAFSCGFNDSAHFTRAFAARMTVTPSEWHRQVH